MEETLVNKIREARMKAMSEVVERLDYDLWKQIVWPEEPEEDYERPAEGMEYTAFNLMVDHYEAATVNHMIGHH